MRATVVSGMRATVAFVLVSGLLAVSCDAAVVTTTCPGNEVACLVDPCSTTTCKPSNTAWQCVASYCGGCNAVWRHQVTGLIVDTCPPDVCILIFQPVCGTDGKTYSNACIALTNGVVAASQGECATASPPASPPRCPNVLSPVCGADGRNYRNQCLATKAGTTVAYAGSCSFPTKCARASLIYTPVCDAATKLTWTNACVAKLNRVTKYTAGPCDGGACARCVANSGCEAPHRCKGNARYTCEPAACDVNHIQDSGRRVTYQPCSPIYKNKATGYPAAACYP